MITHQQNSSVQSATTAAGPTIPGATSVSGQIVEVGNQEIAIDQQIPANSTGLAVSGSFTASAVQSIMILSSQNLTLMTNSASSPSNTINLKANVPFMWSVSAAYFANPFTSNVTGFYVTNTSACRLRIRILTS